MNKNLTPYLKSLNHCFNKVALDNVPFKKKVVQESDSPVKVVMTKTRNRSNFFKTSHGGG